MWLGQLATIIHWCWNALQVEASKVEESVTAISGTREETEELESSIKLEVEQAK